MNKPLIDQDLVVDTIELVTEQYEPLVRAADELGMRASLIDLVDGALALVFTTPTRRFVLTAADGPLPDRPEDAADWLVTVQTLDERTVTTAVIPGIYSPDQLAGAIARL